MAHRLEDRLDRFRRPKRLSPVTYSRLLLPDLLPEAKRVSYEIDIRRVMRGKLALVIADGRTLVDGREIYVANTLRVGLFGSTEGF